MPGSGADTEALILRSILRILAVVFLAACTALLIYDLTAGSVSWIARAGMLALLAAGALVLFLGSSHSLGILRGLEWTVFGAVIGTLLIRENEIMIGAQDYSRTVLQFVLLAMAYAVFVPNRPARALPMLALIILAPLGNLAIGYAGLQARVWVSPGGVGFGLALLGIGALVALAAAKLTHFLMDNAIEARGKFMYELVRKIGSGGMGEVWLGRHQMLSRPVAIKWIRPEALASGDREVARAAIQRFVLEADTTATLRSPHTIEVYDFGVTKGEIFYYSMEYLEGFDLETLVGRYGPVEPERAVHFLVQACESLGEAHGRDFVHRDIKPANLFATHLGNLYDFVKVLDFGLVKPGDLPAADLKLTREGTTTGTPAYMAPETVEGQAELTARVDIYALGCVAYWLLTANTVFDETTPLSMAVAHVSKPPLAPSERTELEVPGELDRIVLRCLEKDPGKRFQTMEELAEALRGLKLSAEWSPKRAVAWWGRHQPQQTSTKTNS